MTQNAQQPDMPRGWAHATLGEICLQVPKVQPHDEPGEAFTYLDIASIDNTTYRVVSPKSFLGRDAPSRARQKVRASNTLFSTVRTYLKNIAMVPPEFDGQVASTGFCVLNPADEIDPRFLFYYAVSDDFISALNPLQRGTSYPAVRDDDVLSQRIGLPPLTEQRRIVAEIERQFTRLDASVAALRRAQANLKRYRASTLRAACSGELVSTEAELARAEGREYEPAVVLLERILAERRSRWESQGKRRGKYQEPTAPDTSDLTSLPEGWVWATVDSLIIEPLSNGRSVKTASGGFPVLRLTALRDGHINQDEYKTGAWTEDDAEPFLIREHDFFVSRGNGSIKLVGLGGIVGPVQTPVAYPDTLIRLRLHPEVALDFFAQMWNSATIRRQIESTARTTAGIHKVNQQDIAACTLPLPPLAEQRRIVAEVERRLSVIQQAEAAVEASLQRAERLRQSILKRAFAGELVPQDPDDEPASVLLERIRAHREAEQAAASAAKRRPARRRNRQNQDSQD